MYVYIQIYKVFMNGFIHLIIFMSLNIFVYLSVLNT